MRAQENCSRSKYSVIFFFLLLLLLSLNTLVLNDLFYGAYRPHQSKEDIGPLKTMFAGAVGGVTLWTSIFPADAIKSRIQVNNLKRSMTSVGLEIIRTEGVMALYNGLLPSVLRTIPATATLFLVYEYTKKTLNELL